MLQLVSYLSGAGIQKGLLLYMVQSLVFFTTFVPLGGGVHHSAPAAGDEESESLKASGRNTHAWMEGQHGAHQDFGARRFCV